MTGFNSKRAMAIGRQTGKSTYNQREWVKNLFMGRFNRPPTKIIWYQLPGRKLKATWEPRAQDLDFGLKEQDMDPIQKWCKQSNCGKRLSFDTWIFKTDAHVTMFLLRWSS